MLLLNSWVLINKEYYCNQSKRRFLQSVGILCCWSVHPKEYFEYLAQVEQDTDDDATLKGKAEAERSAKSGTKRSRTEEKHNRKTVNLLNRSGETRYSVNGENRQGRTKLSKGRGQNQIVKRGTVDIRETPEDFALPTRQDKRLTEIEI